MQPILTIDEAVSSVSNSNQRYIHTIMLLEKSMFSREQLCESLENHARFLADANVMHTSGRAR